jgi:CRP-like cAMP-binding protein
MQRHEGSLRGAASFRGGGPDARAFDPASRVGVSSATQAQMSELLTRSGREFHRGDILFRESDSGDVMYVLHSGWVRISKPVSQEDSFLDLLEMF